MVVSNSDKIKKSDKKDSDEKNDSKNSAEKSTKMPAEKSKKEPGKGIFDDKIRPQKLDQIVGRVNEKKTIKMMIKAAQNRGEVLDHVLFYGPPGLGKTTFAVAIANEIGTGIRITSGPAVERAGDLAAILTGLKKGDVLFIDEVHRLSKVVEEILYPAMEDGMLDIVMGKGPSAKTIRLKLEPFTLIAATTQIGRISSPMRDRFGLIQRLDFFSDDDLKEIIRRAANIYDMEFEESAFDEISKRARGTGRVALRLFRRVRDFCESDLVKREKLAKKNPKGGFVVMESNVKDALDLLGIDEDGLEEIDRNILEIMYKNFDGGPVGLSTLAAAISEDVSTITDVYEPYLMKLGLIKRTPKGRVLTSKGLAKVSGISVVA